MEINFKFLKEKIILRIEEFEKYHFISNDEYFFKNLQHVAEDIVEEHVSYINCQFFLQEDPDLLILNIEEIFPNYFKQKKGSLFNITKDLLAYCLYNYAIKHIIENELINKEKINFPPYVPNT